MEAFVQWATILSPIIAVGLAWWTSKCSAKDTAKHIAALNESTTKQVDSIKRLAKLQLEYYHIQINKELWEARVRKLQAIQKQGDMSEYDHMFNQFGDGPDFLRKKYEQESNLAYEEDFQTQYAKVLENFQSRLYELDKELDK